MRVEQRGLRLFVFAAGPLVLVSYAVGIARAAEPTVLWGGVTGAWQLASIPFMFIAALGFLTFVWITLFGYGNERLRALRWPWAAADGRGHQRLLLAFALYVVPSAFWFEATLRHVTAPAWWTAPLVVAVLFVVSVGTVLMGLLAWSARADRMPRGRVLVAAAAAMAYHSIVNDFVIWTLRFPW